MTERTRVVGVDVGGTFTDVVALRGHRVVTAKVLTDLVAGETSVLEGARQVDARTAEVFNLASTAGLNAILTRRFPTIGFLTTAGHRDVLDRGRLGRPLDALTDLSWRRGISDSARPVVPRHLRRGVTERLAAGGDVLVPLDEESVRRELRILGTCSIAGVAVCLLHAYRNPVHELRVRELVREVLGPDVACSLSSEASPLVGEFPRAMTTVVDVVMKLTHLDHTARLQAGLEELGFAGRLNHADCSAMLMPHAYAMHRPHRLVVGGPAAGTVAAAHFGAAAGAGNLLCADVGGTSCDISMVLDGRPLISGELELEWDLVVSAPATDIVTLGAGGGSLVSVGPAGEMRTGPDSAGAAPGLACYGLGGTRPTLTDAAVAMGMLAPEGLAGGTVPLDPGLAERAFARLDTRVPLPERIRQAWAAGAHDIAGGVGALAARRGIDVRDFDLVAFGGFGPLLLPELLDLLPLRSVVVPPNPGGFSAVGLLSSDRVFSESRSLHGVLGPELAPALADLLDDVEARLLASAGLARDEVTVARSFDGRLAGQSRPTPFVPVLPGPVGPAQVDEMVRSFHREYRRRNGNAFESMRVEVVAVHVRVVAPSPKVEHRPIGSRPAGAPVPQGTTRLTHRYGEPVTASTVDRTALLAGDVLPGPAIVREQTSTTVIPRGRRAVVGVLGELVIT